MPNCPRHNNIPMVLRTARQGKYRGREFYGCPKYPDCKKIIDVKTNQTQQINNNLNDNTDFANNNYNNSRQNIKIPVFLQAREKFQDFQVNFYESLAVPQALLEQINLEEISRKEVEQNSQWRIDYPINADGYFDDSFKQLFVVADKILSRGYITLVSPFIEKGLQDYFKIKTLSKENFDLKKYVGLSISQKESSIWFDGKGTEKQFYENILYELLGPYYRKFVLPQVHFSSLVPNANDQGASAYQRADFFLCTHDQNVIVELDGADHEAHKLSDDQRDDILRNSGYKVIRIRNEEVEKKTGANFQQLYDLVKNYFVSEIQSLSNEEKFILAIKFAHQLQLTVVRVFLSGFFKFEKKVNIYFDDKSLIFDQKDTAFILELVADDIKNLLKNIAILYKRKINVDNINILFFDNRNHKITNNSIVISYNENIISDIPRFIIQDISFNGRIAHHPPSTQIEKIEDFDEATLEYFLTYIFRYNSFLEGQYDAIVRALNGKDAMILLPTGAGKSLAFQLASMILPGVAIVIEPTISLIDDQVDNLQRIGIDRAIGITSQISDPELKSKVINLFGQGEYIFCYVSPERFQTEKFRNTITGLKVNTPISVIIVDEAHCVSEWGHDFRTSYLNIGRTTRKCCESNNRIPPLLALTGTASSAVLKDVRRELQIHDFEAIITPKTFDRKELKYSVFELSSKEKSDILKRYLQTKLPEKFRMSNTSFYQSRDKDTKCGLIFCPHVGGSFGVIEIAQKISNELGIPAKFYGGKAPKGWQKDEWDNYKIKTAKDFKNNKFCLLVATKSFGMGIDKPNIRYTIHFGIPNSIESFYQEAGRAGRDKKHAECAILISNDKQDRTNKLLNLNATSEDIAKIIKEERDWETDDDVTRAMWFHAQSFKGVGGEVEDVNLILNDERVENLMIKKELLFIISEPQKNLFEKGIHRLVILGVVSDYTINYSNSEFCIHFSGIDKKGIIDNYAKYVSGYNKGMKATEVKKMKEHEHEDLKQFVKSAVQILIEFIYYTIEKGRRRALKEMLTLAEAPFREENQDKDQDSLIRNLILRYLESTYAEEIERILDGESAGGFQELKQLVDGHETETGEIVGGIRSPKNATEVRGQVARYLESTANHPGLLFLRSLSEAYCPNPDIQVIIENIILAANFALKDYAIEKEILYSMIVWIIDKISERNKLLCKPIVEKLVYNRNDYQFAKILLSADSITDDLLYIPSLYIFHQLSKEAINIFKS